MEYQAYDKFEYKIIDIISEYNLDLEKKFNYLGEEGWELVTILNNRYFFKRKLNCYNDMINE